ncbi:MBL fold metallo-hydrolase [Actinotalea sp. K2]|uniref:MBL fold metallo-hydrolase n=1 Tax=Actinotalea sp. K2 TaxID=2939438 RepID=UPI002016CE23|nr:MBL fold metallo-hydrolase [Actinotalea sp. K2]MCL3862324.1 MBL fold metallo-hydrolase [Actinotalea sp. K2]
MLIRTVVAPVLGTNCYVVSDDVGRCVVVDPGAGVVDAVLEVITRHGLRPVGMLATHGHVDHTWSAAALGDALGLPLHVHAADAYRLADPFGTLGPLGAALAQAMGAGGEVYRAPRTAVFDGGEAPSARLHLGTDPRDQLALTALHAPGHTEGSTIYLLDGAPGPGSELPDSVAPPVDVPDGSDEPSRTALTGDVLFAGSIGRTDLPGGDTAAMNRTLRERVARIPPSTLVLPGHGPTSRIDVELARNPYLRAAR